MPDNPVYCRECKQLLKAFQVRFQVFFECDNIECKLYGIVVTKGLSAGAASRSEAKGHNGPPANH